MMVMNRRHPPPLLSLTALVPAFILSKERGGSGARETRQEQKQGAGMQEQERGREQGA